MMTPLSTAIVPLAAILQGAALTGVDPNRCVSRTARRSAADRKRTKVAKLARRANRPARKGR